MKMIAVAPHHLIYIHLIYPVRLLDIVNFGVGYCFIHTTGNARAGFQDKADIVPTPYFYLSLSSGNWLAIKKERFMKAKNEDWVYEAPIVEIIEVEIERGFVGSNVENPIEGEESDW